MGRTQRFAKNLVGSFFGSPQRKYQSRHALMTSLCARWSLHLYNTNLLWYQDDEYQSMWRGFAEATGGVAERKFTLYSIAQSIKNLTGDTAECGSFRGAGSFIILSAIAGTQKCHHIFDSFEGLSEPGAEDAVTSDQAYKWAPGDLQASESLVQENLAAFENFETHKGWIPERFNDVADREFSLVHIDVDLYQPTLDSIEFFFPRMQSGGMLICDDYGFDTCPGAYRAMNEFFADKAEAVVHLTTGQGVVWKR